MANLTLQQTWHSDPPPDMVRETTRDPVPLPTSGIKAVETVVATEYGPTKVFYQAAAGQDFAYGTPGQLPSGDIGAIFLYTETDAPILTIFNFTPLSFAELAALDTAPEFNAYFFGGADSFSGSNGADNFNAFGGNDQCSGGGGADTLLGSAGNDSLNGDLGKDTLNGGSGGDGLSGGDGNDLLRGGTGDDRLSGNNQNDTLQGNAGNDKLTGGFGRDFLTGGSGRDVFAYQTLSQFNGQESGLTTATRDVITDFVHGIDKIDVSFILTTPFEFLGTGPLKGLGDINYRYSGGNTIVSVSTDADAAAELSIQLNGRITLDQNDFIL